MTYYNYATNIYYTSGAFKGRMVAISLLSYKDKKKVMSMYKGLHIFKKINGKHETQRFNSETDFYDTQLSALTRGIAGGKLELTEEVL